MLNPLVKISRCAKTDLAVMAAASWISIMDVDTEIHLSDFNLNLQNRSFKGQNLASINFSGADLRGCDFTSADLTGANLIGVRTGQSDRQRRFAIAIAMIGPLILVGGSIVLAMVLDNLIQGLPEPLLKSWSGWAVALGWLYKTYFHDRIARRYPGVSDGMGILAVSVLLIATGVISLGLLGLFWDNLSHQQGLAAIAFGLVNAVALGLVWRIWQWLKTAIQSSFGTSFRKANLTDANLTRSELWNTDFSFAALTGVCIADWSLGSHNQFLNVSCDYLYTGNNHQQRLPPEGKLQPREWERLLDRPFQQQTAPSEP
ncbi:MAG TPA: pentapeptide repeat-containing protein [Coleofasciculaceae cyanobacterium]